jgi:hypothetical protein
MKKLLFAFIIFSGGACFASPFCLPVTDKKLADQFYLPQDICVDHAAFQSTEQADEFVWVNLHGNPYSLNEGWGRFIQGEQGETLIATIVDSTDHVCGGKIHTLLYLRLNSRGEYYGLESGKSYMETFAQANSCPKLNLNYK